jgi:hypothetical protein
MNRHHPGELPPRHARSVTHLGFTGGLWLCLATSLVLQAAGQPQVTQLGPVKATLSLSPPTPTIGDEIVLEIVVEAEAGVELLMPEFGEALERYSIVDFVPKQRIDGQGRTIHTQRYTLQPFLSGEQSIPPILIEFIDRRPGQKPSPDDYDAYELMTERIDFTVASVLPASASAELKPPMGTLDLPSQTSRWLGWGIGGLVGLVLLAILAVTWLARGARRRSLRRNAYELARQQVDRLIDDRQAVSPTLSVERFYVEISNVIRQYLENRFEVRAPELTTDEFLQLAAAESQLSAEHQQLLAEFLNQADRVKFASGAMSTGMATEGDVHRSCELAVQFLEETRENAPDVELSAVELATNAAGPVGQGTRNREVAQRV